MNAIETVRHSVRALLDSGDLDTAAKALAEAETLYPKSVAVKILRAELRCATGKAAEGLLALVGLIAGDPDGAHRSTVAASLAELARRTDLSLDDAIRLGRAAVSMPGPPHERIAVLTVLLDTRTGTDGLAFLRAVAPDSGLARFEWKLAVAEAEAGHVDEALATLQQSRAEGRANALSILLEADLLSVVDRDADAVDLLAAAVEAEPDRPDNWRRLITAADRAGDTERSTALVEAALDRWPRDWMLLFRLNRIRIDHATFARIMSRLAPQAEAAAAAEDRYRFQYAIALLRLDKFAAARAMLAAPFIPPVAMMADPVRSLLAARPESFWLPPDRIEDDRMRDVMVARVDEPRATFVITTGVFFGFLPTGMIDAILAGHAVNRVYLRDFRKRAYCRGIASLGADEAESLAGLRSLVGGLGADRVMTLGSSLGGYGAFRIGALFGAEAAVSLSGPSDPRLFYADTRNAVGNPAWFNKLTLDRDAGLETDLVPIVAAAGGTRFIQYYPEDNPSDRMQALRFAGTERVELRPIAGAGHHVIANDMMADGRLDDLIEVLLG